MAEDVQILQQQPLDMDEKNAKILEEPSSTIEKQDTEQSGELKLKLNEKDNLKDEDEPVMINSFILPLHLNDDRPELNSKYSTYPGLSKVKFINFIKNTLAKSRTNARKNSGHYSSLSFSCDQLQDIRQSLSITTTTTTTTTTTAAAAVAVASSSVLPVSLPSEETIETTLTRSLDPQCTVDIEHETTTVEVVENESDDDDRKFEKTGGGININAVHRAVLRGSIVKLPEMMMNEHPVTIYPGYRNSALNNLELKSPPHPHSETNSLTLDGLRDETDTTTTTTTDSCPKSSSDATSNLSASRRSSLSTFDEDSFIAAALPNIQETKISFNLKLNNSGSGGSGGGVVATPSPVTNDGNALTWDEMDSHHHHHHHYQRLPAQQHSLEQEAENEQQHQLELELEQEKELTAARRLHAIARQSPDSYNSMLGKGTFLIRRRRKSANNNNQLMRDNFNAGNSLESYRKMKNHLSLDLPKAMILHRDRVTSNLMEPSVSYNLHHNMCKATSPTDARNLHKLNASGAINRDLNMPVYYGGGGGGGAGNYCTGSVNDSLTVPSVSNLIGTNGHNMVDMLHNSLSDLAPTVEEEDEELSSDRSSICGPLRKIENNISALLRGEMAAVVRVEDMSAASMAAASKRSGIYKSESAKEMLLSQNTFGPLPPSPPSSSSELIDYNDLPLPPSPPVLMNSSSEELEKKPGSIKNYTTSAEVHHGHSLNNRDIDDLCKEGNSLKEKSNTRPVRRLMTDELPLPPLPPSQPVFEYLPPIIFTHRGQQSIASNNTNTNTATTTNNSTMKSWSNESSSRRTPPWTRGYGSQVTTPTSSQTPLYDGSLGAVYSAKRTVHYGNKRSQRQSPKDENRLQTSCSLPETPIFARGSDIASTRTPFRRIPNEGSMIGCRTAPRSVTANNINMGSGVMGIFGGTMILEGASSYHHHYQQQQQQHRSINHALASNELLRIAGAPQRGWYPKQRAMRPVSTDNIDRIKSTRVWDSSVGAFGTGTGTNSRKIFTLPSNLTPSFLNKSPREALRRVTSLLITRKKFPKENYKNYYERGDYAVCPTNTAITASSRDFTRVNGPPKRNKDNSNRKTSTTTSTNSNNNHNDNYNYNYNYNNNNSNNNNSNNRTTTSLPNDLPKKNIFKCLWKRTKRISSSK